MTQRRERRLRFLIWGASGWMIFAAASANAQPADEDTHADRFTNRYWSQSRPDRNYLNGCVTGYRAFMFSDNGYFVFDRRIHGSWRLDQLNNLILRTRDGVRIRLIFDQQQTLSPSANVAFLRRDERFQECRD